MPRLESNQRIRHPARTPTALRNISATTSLATRFSGQGQAVWYGAGMMPAIHDDRLIRDLRRVADSMDQHGGYPRSAPLMREAALAISELRREIGRLRVVGRPLAPKAE